MLALVCFFNKACTAGSLQNSLFKNRLRRCLVRRRFILRLQLSLSFFSDLQACFASPRFTASMKFLRFSQHSQSNQIGFSGPFLHCPLNPVWFGAVEYGQWIKRNRVRSHRVWTVDESEPSQEPESKNSGLTKIASGAVEYGQWINQN